MCEEDGGKHGGHRCQCLWVHMYVIVRGKQDNVRADNSLEEDENKERWALAGSSVQRCVLMQSQGQKWMGLWHDWPERKQMSFNISGCQGQLYPSTLLWSDSSGGHCLKGTSGNPFPEESAWISLNIQFFIVVSDNIKLPQGDDLHKSVQVAWLLIWSVGCADCERMFQNQIYSRYLDIYLDIWFWTTFESGSNGNWKDPTRWLVHTVMKNLFWVTFKGVWATFACRVNVAYLTQSTCIRSPNGSN